LRVTLSNDFAETEKNHRFGRSILPPKGQRAGREGQPVGRRAARRRCRCQSIMAGPGTHGSRPSCAYSSRSECTAGHPDRPLGCGGRRRFDRNEYLRPVLSVSCAGQFRVAEVPTDKNP